MRIALAAITLAAISATRLYAQDSTAIVCHTSPCVVVFEWGNSGALPPEPDRRYGAASDLESSFLSGLEQSGLQVSRTGQAPTTLLVRITPKNKALCDMAVGTDPDYSCHTADRATITIQQSDSPKGGVRHVELNPRCSDTKASPTFAQFGRFAAEYFVFVAGGQKGHHSTTIRC